MAEIFQYVFRLGDIQLGLLYDTMHDCYEEAGFDGVDGTGLLKLADLERKIRHYEERRGIRNVLVRSTWKLNNKVRKWATRCTMYGWPGGQKGNRGFAGLANHAGRIPCRRGRRLDNGR